MAPELFSQRHMLRKERVLREPEIHRRLAAAQAKLAAIRASQHVIVIHTGARAAGRLTAEQGREYRTAALASDGGDASKQV